MSDILKSYQDELEKLNQTGNLRYLKQIDESQFKLNLSSNDYMGIAKLGLSLPAETGMGSGSSRLLTGNFQAYQALEDELEKQFGAPALFFNSGYHANIGILPALAQKGDLILSDKLNHASIIDGIKLSDADYHRYKHLDTQHLTRLLKKYRSNYKRVFIVSESIFSMDGDVADLHELIRIKNKHKCFLYVDEAHALGTRGEKGLGIAEEQNCLSQIDLLVGTFGKAMNSVGAYLICNAIIKEYLINKMRSLIFTTALPPISIAWNLQILKQSLGMQKERLHLQELSNQFRTALQELGIQTGGDSNIIPIMIGDSEKCKQLAEQLQDLGYLVFPIRPPSVPPNTARLRLSLSADMQWEDLKELPVMIKNLQSKYNS
ncbi:8-amino-7-oxononanoate synthase [Ancylomarina salipaludis]|uniref:8-amino-7-oxononanoate synthase n=1 Tax=Ancylomarina salipaludis TaxID=2501299 RepID=A0A4Q1JMN6_9BACT|nr:8-amino-7-oxononanoate synthase [Ancylomarina salipaludis]RXQ95802.1 8-amino-7-oxononanoate synthase [Ancylomarina salipaludis]